MSDGRSYQTSSRTTGTDVTGRQSLDSLLSSDDNHSTDSEATKPPYAGSHNGSNHKAGSPAADNVHSDVASQETKHDEEQVTWMSLPKKGQLAVLTIARLSEPLSERSLAAYMFYQLRWFNSSAPDSEIASQGGLLVAAFAAAQFVTAVWWGRAADTPWIGRKRVLLVGLTGTAIASIGVGFSKTFYQAFCFRALAGALNGNIGVMRTMLSEIIKDKKYQSRAFLLLPMCFNVGVIIGPILGGFLADPITAFPNVFGPGSWLGGKNGLSWMVAFPYALPNLFSGIFIFISAMSVVFGLDETHEALRHEPDCGRRIGKYFTRMVCRSRSEGYARVASEETDTEMAPITRTHSNSGAMVFPRSVDLGQQSPAPQVQTQSPFRAILTRNVLLTLTSHHLLALHVSSFNALIFLLLPAPYSPNSSHHFPSLRWTGGLGLSQERVGLAMAILGVIGLPLQILLYPTLNTRMGTLSAYRTFLPFSVVAYAFLPFLVLLPERPAWLVWVLLSLVLASQVLSRTFALTGTVILVNNSSPSRASLGTIHGVAQSASSAARMLGPTVGGWLLGLGLQHRFVGGVWWLMAVIAAVQWCLLFLIYEGDGKGGRA